jgi:predicted GNAT superfamily acetyltransferase
MIAEIQVRKSTSLADFHRCVEIQREVWGESDLEVEPYVTFVVANQTGGQVLCAFDGGRMVGFTMALAGVRNASPYLHSHMTAVIASHRDRGVGRLLKLFQRDEALGRGILIEWTFDPLETRNAHFNFNRLGAIARNFIPNFYGVTSSPLHRGLPTDRLLAEWFLDSERVANAVSNAPAELNSSLATIRVSAEIAQWQQTDMPRVLAEQTRIRSEFQDWFAKGYAAIGVRFTAAGAEYALAPWSDF